MRMLALVIVLALGAFLAWGAVSARPIARASGIIAPIEPLQTALAQPVKFAKDGFQVTALAGFELQARVILKADYGDTGARIAPVDLALGWGPMSDSRVLDALNVYQSERFYFFEAKDQWPLPLENVGYYSANMHMIPSSASVERTLRGLKAGNIVRLRGYLVRVDGPDGFNWVSSLTRTDAGNGACELVWVESIQAS
jgi:hypothetical protein